MSTLLLIYPVFPEGKDTVPEPIITIFTVPTIAPVVIVVELKFCVLSVADVEVLSVTVPEAFVVLRVLTVSVSVRVHVVAAGIERIHGSETPLLVMEAVPDDTTIVPVPEHTVPAPKVNPPEQVNICPELMVNVPV